MDSLVAALSPITVVLVPLLLFFTVDDVLDVSDVDQTNGRTKFKLVSLKFPF